MKNIHFGAGNIGRGFIGDILFKSGYQITFVDVDETLVDALKQAGKYDIIELSHEANTYEVSGVTALNSLTEEAELVKALASCDLVTTAMGVNNLKFIKGALVKMIDYRIENNIDTKINIVCCENGIRISSNFKKEFYADLTKEQQEHASNTLGFVDASVDRIVPNQSNENICDVKVEPDCEWIVDLTQLVKPLAVKDVTETDNLDYYNQRKLLSVNAGHAACAYLGYKKGYKYIHEALGNKKIHSQVFLFLHEVKIALSYQFDFDIEAHNLYIDKIIKRFSNELLKDDIMRVARNPITKLGSEERLIKPLKILLNNEDENYQYIVKIINAALDYNQNDDVEAHELAKQIRTNSKKIIFEEISNVNTREIIELIS